MLATHRRNRVLRVLALAATTTVAFAAVPAHSASAATTPGSVAVADARPRSAETKTAPGQPSFGEKGPSVEAVQRALVSHGFTLRGGVTGIFDARTRRTLRNFQKVVGLKVTGIVDMRTAQVLKLAAPASILENAASGVSPSASSRR